MIAKHNMFAADNGVVLGLSGGADSVALLHLLQEIAFNLRIVCVHVNHGLRGADARADAEFCRELCKKMEIEIIIFDEDAAAMAVADKISVEEAGRKLRYSRFEHVRTQHGLDVIAVAHNKNDVAETVLMQALRGAGALRGITPVNGKVVRPLIAVTRNEIEEYCHTNALAYCTDATNFDNTHTRNKIRNVFLPMVLQDVSPLAVDALARLADIASAEDEFLDKITKNLYTNCVKYMQNGVSLDIVALSQSDIVLRRRVIRNALAEVYGSLANISYAHVDAVLGLIGCKSGSEVTLPKGCIASRVYDAICIRQQHFQDAFFVNLSKGETVYVPSYRKYVGLYDYIAKENAFTMLLDCGKIEKMQVRTRLPGDTIRFDAVGTKKIKDYFIDKKTPRHERDAAIFVASGSDIVLMLEGFVKSDKFKPAADSGPLYLQIWDA